MLRTDANNCHYACQMSISIINGDSKIVIFRKQA